MRLEHYRNINLEDRIGKEAEDILNENMKDIREQIDSDMENIELKINDKMDKINIESVTVISIFSAIIMAFFGGLSFFGDSLKNMNKVDPQLTLSVIVSVGIAMFNIFYILLKFVSVILEKSFIEKKYFYIINILLFILLITINN